MLSVVVFVIMAAVEVGVIECSTFNRVFPNQLDEEVEFTDLPECTYNVEYKSLSAFLYENNTLCYNSIGNDLPFLYYREGINVKYCMSCIRGLCGPLYITKDCSFKKITNYNEVNVQRAICITNACSLDDNSAQPNINQIAGYEGIDKCSMNMTFLQNIIYTNCSPYYKIALHIMIGLVVNCIFYVVKLFLKRMRIEKTDVRKNYRYTNYAGRKVLVKRPRAYNHTVIKSKSSLKCCISIILLIQHLSYIHPCSLVPILSTDYVITNDNKLNNTQTHTEISFSTSNQKACLIDSDGNPIEIVFKKISRTCISKVEYYTPRGSLSIKSKSFCSGEQRCDAGEYKATFDELSAEGSYFGWAHLCWSPYYTCNVLKFNVKVDEMCEVYSCMGSNDRVSLDIRVGNFRSNKEIMAGIPFIINNKTAIIIEKNQFSLSNKKYLRCNGELFDTSANDRNVHIPDLVGSIQCPNKCYDNSCSMNLENLYRLRYDGKVITNVDLSYKSLITRLTKTAEGLDIDINNFHTLKLNLWTNSSVKLVKLDDTTSISMVELKGETMIKDGITISYYCKSSGGTFIFSCPNNFVFTISCDGLGEKSSKLSYDGIAKAERLSCEVFSGQFKTDQVMIEINATLPSIDLLIVSNDPNYSIDGGYSMLATTNIIIGFLLSNPILTIFSSLFLLISLIHHVYKYLKE